MLLLSILALASAAGVQEKILQPFSFRELVAGQSLDESSLNAKGCAKIGARVQCIKVRDKVADIEAMTVVDIYEGKLASLSITVGKDDFGKLSSSFSQKYGQPCSSEYKEFRNGRGGVFTGNIHRWCFQTGTMTFFEFGANGQDSDAVYVDNVVKVPRPKPKVDF
jgi:hypothetical protein